MTISLRVVVRMLARLIRTTFRTTCWLVYVALLTPWVVVALAGLLTRKVTALRRFMVSIQHTFDHELLCPAGHPNSLHGIFECRGCGSLFAGYAFGRCPSCGDSCGYIPCEHCGLAVRNPFLR